MRGGGWRRPRGGGRAAGRGRGPAGAGRWKGVKPKAPGERRRRGNRAEGRAARGLRRRKAGRTGGDAAGVGEGKRPGRAGPGQALHLPQRRGLRRSAPPRRCCLARPSSSAPARGAGGGAGPGRAGRGPGCSRRCSPAGRGEGGGEGPGARRAAGSPMGLAPGRGVCVCACSPVFGAGPSPPWGAEAAVCPRRWQLQGQVRPGEGSGGRRPAGWWQGLDRAR